MDIDDSVVHVHTGARGTVLSMKGEHAVMVRVRWSSDDSESWLPIDLLRKDGRLPSSIANRVFHQNDGEVTKAYYAKMNALGLPGQLAVALFRAQKRSTAAKKYRRGKFTRAAYDVKNWSLSEVCRILSVMASFESAPLWGWKHDRNTPGYEWVLYVDLPTGQCSFHSPERLNGPDYPKEWDRVGMSEERICRYCDMVEGL